MGNYQILKDRKSQLLEDLRNEVRLAIESKLERGCGADFLDQEVGSSMDDRDTFVGFYHDVDGDVRIDLEDDEGEGFSASVEELSLDDLLWVLEQVETDQFKHH